jgi:4-diphosphocytidyl-2C-methyl-D-erythritol kinase
MTPKEIKILRKKLPKSWAKTLAKEYMVSTQYVYAIFKGKRKNNSVLASAIIIAEKHQMTMKNLSEKINSL